MTASPTASSSKCIWAWVLLGTRPTATRGPTWAATTESTQLTNLIFKRLPHSMAVCKETPIHKSRNRRRINRSTSRITGLPSSQVCPKLGWVSKKGCKTCQIRKVDLSASLANKSKSSTLATRWDRRIRRLLGTLTADSIQRMSEAPKSTAVASKAVASNNKMLFMISRGGETPKAQECFITITSGCLPTQLAPTSSNTHLRINIPCTKGTKRKSWWPETVNRYRTVPMTASSGALSWVPTKFRKSINSQGSRACRSSSCRATILLTRSTKGNQRSLAVVSNHKIKRMLSWKMVQPAASRQQWECHQLLTAASSVLRRVTFHTTPSRTEFTQVTLDRIWARPTSLAATQTNSTCKLMVRKEVRANRIHLWMRI